LNIGNPVGEDQSKGKCFLEGVECFIAEEVKISSSILPG